MTDLKAAAKEILKGVDRLAAMSPAGGCSFLTMMSSISNSGLTPAAARAVTAAALGVADGCETCACRNARDAALRGVSREQFKLALQRGILMGQTSVSIYAAAALVDFDRARPQGYTQPAPAARKSIPLDRKQSPVPAFRPPSIPIALAAKQRAITVTDRSMQPSIAHRSTQP